MFIPSYAPDLSHDSNNTSYSHAPLTGMGEMWGHGIKAHTMCYCVCNLKVGKWSPTSMKIPWYKPSNRLALSFLFIFMKWEWQNNEYSDFFWKRAIDYFSLRSDQQIKHKKNENIQIKEDKDEVSKNWEMKGKKWK